jgi:hypothetical protein
MQLWLWFLVLLAFFLSASDANAFTSLSPFAGHQVWENHLIQFKEPMSKLTNKPSDKPTMDNQTINYGPAL